MSADEGSSTLTYLCAQSARPDALFGREQPPDAGDLHEVRPDHGDPNQWYEDQDALDDAIPTGDELGTENDDQSERQRPTQERGLQASQS